MKMEIEELLEIASELRASVKTYISETADYGEIIVQRERDVTRRVDLFAERALEQALKSRGLCARIISEELGDRVFPSSEEGEGGGREESEQKQEPEFTLIFDPVDGSTNAVLGIPFFCSSLAYSPKTEQITFEDIQASVVATFYGKTFYAVKGEGGGAFVGREGERLPRKLTGKRKRVYSFYTYGAGEETIPASLLTRFQEVVKKNAVVRVLGSIAVEICLVAEGVVDAVTDVRGLINGYDIAGASLILREAGGSLTDLRGKGLEGEEVGETRNISLVAALEPGIHKGLLARYDEK